MTGTPLSVSKEAIHVSKICPKLRIIRFGGNLGFSLRVPLASGNTIGSIGNQWGLFSVIRRSTFRRASACLALASLTPGVALAQGMGVDPAGSGVLVSAVTWLQGTLLGTVATVVAVIAVASVGFLMLTGRINWRYGATVILGCFILFGAASIVAGIQSTAQSSL
jgi:type IV secretion system protein VirB2